MTATAIKELRKDVKKYIDHADERVLKMVRAMLEADTDAVWWETMPDNVKADINEAILQADRGQVLTHQQVKEKYPQWFSK